MSEESVSSVVKHDWYQSSTHVTVNVLIRNLNQNDVSVQITQNRVHCVCKQSDQTTYELHLNLFKPITDTDSRWRLTPSKLEIILKKRENIQWSNLERVSFEDNPNRTKKEPNKNVAPIQPKDALKPNQNVGISMKNWDKIISEFEKEEEEEDKKGNGNVDDLFKKIYSQGSEELRRAMNKSFQESGGTVLSTNWSEVSQSKTECKPPDGCELKKWE